MNLIFKFYCIWLFSQIFIYRYIPFFSLRLGSFFYPDRFLFLLILFLFLKNILSSGFSFLKLGWVEFLLIFLILVSFFSYYTHHPDILLGTNKFLVTIFNFSVFPLFIFIVLTNIKIKENDIKFFLLVLFSMGVYLSYVSFLEHYQILNYIFPKYIADPFIRITQPGRAGGPFLNGGTLGRVLIATILASLILKNYVKKSYRLYILLGTLVMMASLYFSNTRGPYLAFAVVMFFLFVFEKGQIKRDVTVLALVAILIIVSGVAGKLDILGKGTIFSSRPQTIDYRFLNYSTSINMIKSNVFQGIGYGMFDQRWPEYIPSNNVSENLNTGINLSDGNHNTFLGVFSELGLLGFLPYIMVLLIMFRSLYKNYTVLKDDSLSFSINLFAMGYLFVFFFTGQFADLRNQLIINSLLFTLFALSQNITQARVQFSDD